MVVFSTPGCLRCPCFSPPLCQHGGSGQTPEMTTSASVQHHGSDIEMSLLQGSASVVASGPSVAFLTGRWSGEVGWGCSSRSGISRGSGFCGSWDWRLPPSQSDLLTHGRLSGGPLLLEKYPPMSTLPISTKRRSTTDPSKYPKAGPNTAMAKRMAEKREQREPV